MEDYKILRDSKGVRLSDIDVIRTGLSCIAKHMNKTGKAPIISYNFIQWMKGAVEAVDKRCNITESEALRRYKDLTIQHNFDIDGIIANTEARNKKLEKKGEFKTKVDKIVKGRSK